jgi:cathepsin X
MDSLSLSLDWRAYESEGKTFNLLSWTKNQHIPTYCGSCWAQGTTSSLADRFNILNWKRMDNSEITPVALSAQVIVNCHEGGNCQGGDPILVYDYAYKHGIPHASCEQYVAVNLDCNPIDICRECIPPAPESADEHTFQNCHPVSHTKYYASSVRKFSGIHKMKAELAAYGPISCGINSTHEFGQYNGQGVFS